MSSNLSLQAASVVMTPATWRSHSALALPLAAQQIGLQLMGMVDVAMLGHYHPDALAGAGVANSLVFSVSCVGMGVMMGLDSIVPAAIGRGDVHHAHRSFRAALRLGVWVGLAATLLTLISPLLLLLTRVDANVANEAKIFVFARSFGVLPFMLQVAMRSYLSAFGNTRPLLWATILGNLLNLLLDWILIYGDDSLRSLGLPAIGLPPMGVLGAAIATSCVQVLTLLVYWRSARVLLANARTAVESPAANDIREVLKYGIPVGGHMLAEVGVFALAGVLAANISTPAAGAHNVAITLASFSFSIAVGIGAATSTQVGQAFGAKSYLPTGSVRRAARIGLAVGGVVMSLFALIFVIFPLPLARLFSADPAVIATTVGLMHIAAIFQISDGAQAIAAGALRGIGDTKATFVANVIGHYAVGLAVSLILAFGFGMGVVGLWWGLSAGLTATAIALLLRFWRKTSR
jgi:multidrug resistance protein, MATE family